VVAETRWEKHDVRGCPGSTRKTCPMRSCQHQPVCPAAEASDREAAHVVAPHPEQGWSLLCNGVVLFDDTGELLPDGSSIPPHRPTDIPAHAA